MINQWGRAGSDPGGCSIVGGGLTRTGITMMLKPTTIATVIAAIFTAAAGSRF
jgi:hypothetical protein